MCGHQIAEVKLPYQRLRVLVFCFEKKKLGIWSVGNIRERRQKIQMKSIERWRDHFELLHSQTNRRFSRVRTQTGISVSAPLRDELRYASGRPNIGKGHCSSQENGNQVVFFDGDCLKFYLARMGG